MPVPEPEPSATLAPIRISLGDPQLLGVASWSLMCGALAAGWGPTLDKVLQLAVLWVALVGLLLPTLRAWPRALARAMHAVLSEGSRSGRLASVPFSTPSGTTDFTLPAAMAPNPAIEPVFLGETTSAAPLRARPRRRRPLAREIDAHERTELASWLFGLVLVVMLLLLVAPSLVLPALGVVLGAGLVASLRGVENAAMGLYALTTALVIAVPALGAWLAFDGAQSIPAPVAVAEGLAGGARWWLSANAAWPVVVAAFVCIGWLSEWASPAERATANSVGAEDSSLAAGRPLRLALLTSAYAAIGLVVAWHEQALAFGAVALTLLLQWPGWRRDGMPRPPAPVDAYGLAAMLAAAWAVR